MYVYCIVKIFLHVTVVFKNYLVYFWQQEQQQHHQGTRGFVFTAGLGPTYCLRPNWFSASSLIMSACFFRLSTVCDTVATLNCAFTRRLSLQWIYM